MAQRKVGFFYLHSVNGEVNLDVQENLLRLLSFIDRLTNTQKKRDITRDKICFLDSYDYNENNHIVKILFKSAIHSYRAPLLNRNTIELRENPKTIEEGEQVKTHLLVKYVNGDAIVFLETGRGLLTLKAIVDYLNIFVLLHNNNNDDPICGRFTLDIIPRDDFREVLQNMDRVLLAQVYTDKQILGSDSLNFSDRTENVQEDIVIELRENPKTIEEGEQVKTHLLVKYVNGDAIVFLETGRGLLTLKAIVDYLNIFVLLHNNNNDDPICGRFTLDIIPRDDFREVLQNMDRVLLAQVYTDKQILGSDSLNFSDRTENVQEDIVIELKTKRQQSIKSVLYDILSKMNGNREDIKRVRIKGKMPNNTDCMIDTDFLIKKEYIEVVQNEETGEYHTVDMFNQLELLSNSF